MQTRVEVDVVVVGGGNAGLVAALSARGRGRSVVLLEKAPEASAGGNSYYTAGATRIAHDGLDDLVDLVEPDERHDRTVVPPYTVDEYLADLRKVTGGRTDEAMGRIVASESGPCLRWLQAEHGVRYRLMYERQAYERDDGTFLFWGGLHVGNVGGGEGLIADETRAAERAGVDIRYASQATRLLTEDGRVVGVTVSSPDGTYDLAAESVILASGGFEANPELRERFLGPGWGAAKLRGTPCNTGEMLMAARGIGADVAGDWTTCHATAWDAWAADNESNRELTNRLTRQSYPLGIVVNRLGQRFLDEGADFRNYTYALYGSRILEQPGAIAFQLFDATLRPMLRTEEYDMPGIGVVVADTIEALADGMGVDRDELLRTVDDFNASIDTSVPFDPTVKDGRRAATSPVKSNWANPLETAPYYAYPVTCGITFTFGGLRGDDHGRVVSTTGEPIPGLFACGEALGGLFSGNYPGGTGLATGCVFGRRTGSVA